ncbi:MAG: ABC transporter substrate-binding protein [Limisphaerales bacterium]
MFTAVLPRILALLVPRFPSLGVLAVLALAGLPSVRGASTNSWTVILAEARGQTVYWNAWGGDDRINAYIAWAAAEAKKRFGIEVRHVKLGDTSEAVSRVLAEKAAGNDDRGSVDLIWINGENFSAMKRHGLLHGPFVDRLPNFRFVDTVSKPTLVDFSVPVDGFEAPWSMAQFVFLYDSRRVGDPPTSAAALLEWAKANPGRFSYPQPPDFLGTTFLKQILLELATDRAPLYRSVDEHQFAAISAPLWAYLDELHPVSWRKGRVFPANGPAQTRQLADGEIDIALSFSPEAASSGIETGQLPETVRTFVWKRGTLGNASFLAIPYNGRAKSGALVLVDFLLSPEAQARKADPRHLGSPTVLSLDKLSPTDLMIFQALPKGKATPSLEELGTPVPELHPYWMDRLEKQWLTRYAAGR